MNHPLSVPDSADIAGFVGINIVEQCRYDLLVKHFKPGVDYCFPRRANGHTFQHWWLVQYLSLVYSKHENGGFCLA